MCNYVNSDGYCLLNGNECQCLVYYKCRDFLSYRLEQSMTCGVCNFFNKGYCISKDNVFVNVKNSFSCNFWAEREKFNVVSFNSRKPERIPLFLKVLEDAWLKYPDLRFGQLFYALLDDLDNKGISKDGFYAEEEAWLQAIRKFREGKSS